MATAPEKGGSFQGVTLRDAGIMNPTVDIPATADSISMEDDPRERFRVYRLCECSICGGSGKIDTVPVGGGVITKGVRCPECRGEGRTRDLIATMETPEAVGVALVTLAREGEFEECPIGLLDTQGETGQKWLIRPWGASPRNYSDAGRLLATAAPRKR